MRDVGYGMWDKKLQSGTQYQHLVLNLKSQISNLSEVPLLQIQAVR